MQSTTTTTDADDDPPRCERCQHRVDVPGIGQVVCLAHLAVFNTPREVVCAEFEQRALCPRRLLK